MYLPRGQIIAYPTHAESPSEMIEKIFNCRINLGINTQSLVLANERDSLCIMIDMTSAVWRIKLNKPVFFQAIFLKIT